MDQQLEHLHRSDQHVVRTVDSLPDGQWATASILPGWSKAHVIAHLALNAEGYSRSLEALDEGTALAIYDSNESRDVAIEELATLDPGIVRERFFAATQHFRNVAVELRPETWAGQVLRLPEGPSWPADALIGARWREVEIHHADLGTAYGPTDWPTAFAVNLLDQATGDHADSVDSPDFAVTATDLGRTWTAGAEAPVVRGAAEALGWWLVGRGHGEGLSTTGELPRLGPWRRSPLR